MKKLIVILLLGLLTSGCASMINGDTQTVTIEAVDDIGGTSCSLSNNKGRWYSMPNMPVKVKRSDADLVVKCDNERQKAAKRIEPSSGVGWYVTDFLLVDLCLISCWVDASSDAVNSYAEKIVVMMDYK